MPDPIDSSKIKSDAAELVKQQAQKAKADRLRKQKDSKRIELNLKEGLRRSNQREIDNKKAQIRTFQSRLAQIKFAEENDERRERGIEQKIAQESTMEHRMEDDHTRKQSVIESNKRVKAETQSKIEKLESDLKVLVQEVERKEREIKRLQGDTTIDAETKKAEYEESNTKQRLTAEATLIENLRKEMERYKADEEKKKHEYVEMEKQAHAIEAQLAQLETNQKEYDREIDQLKREVR